MLNVLILTREESAPLVILLPLPSTSSTSTGGSKGKFAATLLWIVNFEAGVILNCKASVYK